MHQLILLPIELVPGAELRHAMTPNVFDHTSRLPKLSINQGDDGSMRIFFKPPPDIAAEIHLKDRTIYILSPTENSSKQCLLLSEEHRVAGNLLSSWKNNDFSQHLGENPIQGRSTRAERVLKSSFSGWRSQLVTKPFLLKTQWATRS